MKVLIIYDSVFRNTERVARAISHALIVLSQVRIIKINEANLKEFLDVKLVILGSPTHSGKPTESFLAFLEHIPRKSL